MSRSNVYEDPPAMDRDVLRTQQFHCFQAEKIILKNEIYVNGIYTLTFIDWKNWKRKQNENKINENVEISCFIYGDHLTRQSLLQFSSFESKHLFPSSSDEYFQSEERFTHGSTTASVGSRSFSNFKFQRFFNNFTLRWSNLKLNNSCKWRIVEIDNDARGKHWTETLIGFTLNADGCLIIKKQFE